MSNAGARNQMITLKKASIDIFGSIIVPMNQSTLAVVR
jgi:hypothetical protein